MQIENKRLGFFVFESGWKETIMFKLELQLLGLKPRFKNDWFQQNWKLHIVSNPFLLLIDAKFFFERACYCKILQA